MNIIKILCLLTGLFYFCTHASGNMSTQFDTDVGISNMRGLLIVLSLTRKETSYCDQTRDLFNILPTKLTTLLSPLL